MTNDLIAGALGGIAFVIIVLLLTGMTGVFWHKPTPYSRNDPRLACECPVCGHEDILECGHHD